MANLDLVNFEDIFSAVARQVKGDTADTETLNKIKESINRRYREIASRKKWKWLIENRRALRLRQRYNTGTISLTNGQRIITGVGTTFTATHRRWWIKPTGDNPSYRVIAVPSATSILINTEHTEATLTGAAYTLYQSEVALPPDLEDIDDVRIDGQTYSVEPRGPAFLNMLKQRYSTMTGKPKYYSIDDQMYFSSPPLGQFILGFDFLGEVLTKAMSVFPHIPDQDYTIHLRYKRKITALVANADIPLIPEEHRHVLFDYVMSDWYFANRQDTTGRYYQGLGDKVMEEMEARYLDTDDYLQFKPMKTRSHSDRYLQRHSESYFDSSD